MRRRANFIYDGNETLDGRGWREDCAENELHPIGIPRLAFRLPFCVSFSTKRASV